MIQNLEKTLQLLADIYDFDSCGFDPVKDILEPGSIDELFEDELEYIAAATASYHRFLKKHDLDN